MTHPDWGDAWSAQVVPEQTPPVEPRWRRRVVLDRRAVLGAVGALVLLGLVGVGWLVADVLAARSALLAARDEVVTLQEQATAGDVESARATVARLQEDAATARTRTRGPVWSLAGVLPWVGDQTGAVQVVADVVDNLAQHGLPPLVDAVALVDPAALAPVDGRVDLDPLRAAAPQVVGADTAVQAAVAQLDALDTSRLVGQLAGPVEELRAQVAEVSTTTATAARAATLLPAMLGSAEPRTYLVLVQNNAEPRATGGIPGTVLVLRAQDGRLDVVDQRRGGDLSGLAEPALPLSDTEDALFSPLVGTDMRDVTFTPDFPRSAALARAIWQQEVGGEVDGVLSVDPGALALVLGATGPVGLDDGSTLSRDNAVAELLNGVYLRLEDPADQDAYFASTAATVFGAVAGGQGDAGAVVDALAQAAREGRLMLWSAHADEQELLAPTVLAGALRGRDGDDSAVIGVYLNDGTQAKMGYYLDLDVTGEVAECRPDGSQVVDLTVTLTSTAPADAATLPDYVVGPDRVVPPGEVATNVLVYGPSGGFVETVRVNSEESGVLAQVHEQLGVVARTFTLAPGQSGTLDLEIVTGKSSTGDVVVRSTPLASGSGPTILPSGCSSESVR